MKLNKKNLLHKISKVKHPEHKGKDLQVQHDMYTYTTSKGDVHVISVSTLTSDNIPFYKNIIDKAVPLVSYYVNEVQWNYPSDVHLAIAKLFPSLKGLVLSEREEHKSWKV